MRITYVQISITVRDKNVATLFQEGQYDPGSLTCVTPIKVDEGIKVS